MSWFTAKTSQLRFARQGLCHQEWRQLGRCVSIHGVSSYPSAYSRTSSNSIRKSTHALMAIAASRERSAITCEFQPPASCRRSAGALARAARGARVCHKSRAGSGPIPKRWSCGPHCAGEWCSPIAGRVSRQRHRPVPPDRRRDWQRHGKGFADWVAMEQPIMSTLTG